MSNREKIVEEARRLMNEQGAQSVGTTQIVEALGISPGNLYYHFNNREEIVREIFSALEADFRSALVADVDPPISAARFAGFYLRSLEVAWSYRFFFGGLLHLLRRDEVLAERYRRMQAWALDNLEEIARQLARDGSMARPKGRSGYRSVALNTWLIWSNWIRFVQISTEDQQVSRGDVVDGVSQIFDVLAPYLESDFDKAARRVLSRELAGESADR